MAKRSRICRKVKGNKKSCQYVIRDKYGRFKRFSNIGKSNKADSRTKAKYHPKKSGYGYKGDY